MASTQVSGFYPRVSLGFARKIAVQPLPAPANLRVTATGKSGELLLHYDKVVNANSYMAETATAPEGPWTFQTLATATRVTISGLTPGKTYWARVCASGAAGASAWGGPATAMAT